MDSWIVRIEPTSEELDGVEPEDAPTQIADLYPCVPLPPPMDLVFVDSLLGNHTAQIKLLPQLQRRCLNQRPIV